MSELFDGDNYRTYNTARRATFLSFKWQLNNWRVLDVGCGDGVFGNSIFHPAGAILTCADGRAEHIATLKRERPWLAKRAQVVDLDSDFPEGQYDLVFACGLLYHLGHPVEFLQSCAEAAPLLFMETVVWNVDQDNIHFWQEREDYDQALNRLGARVTPLWLNRVLKEVGYNFVYEPPLPDHKDFRLDENPEIARVLRIASMEDVQPMTAVGLKAL